VAEIGPGDALGIGIAALLSGARRHFTLDIVPGADSVDRRASRVFVQAVKER